MELNEVKIGDTVSFTHKGKKVTGKVIYRHDGNKNAALAGHINIQPMDADSRPHTIHVSKTRPATQIKEDIQMSDINEAILDLIDNIDAGNHVEANSIFSSLLQHKIDALLDVKKAEVSSSMFNTNECADCEAEEVDEALVGNQHKIDANKNGKVDGHDFKLLRKKKGVKEEVAQVEEEEMEEAAKWRNNPNAHYTSKSGKKVALGDYKHNFSSLQKRKPATFDKGKVTKKHAENLKDRIKHGFSYDRDGVKIGEEVQVDENTFEQGGKMKTDTTPRHVSPHFKHLKKRSYDEIRADALKRAGLTDVSKKSPAVKKEEVTHEAYSDPYAAKKSAEMKKAHAATMADAKKEYDAAKKPKFAKNFMKMKKEEVELEEGNAENKMKKNAYADAKGAANKNLDRGSQRRVDSRRTDEVDSIKKGIDNYAPKKAPVRNIIRGKVFGKLSDTETKMFARKRVKEDVNLQELDDTTTFSYLQKRHGMKTLTHFKPENKVSAKSEKGKTNALASIEKKREAEREISRKATKKAGMGAARDYKKGTYSGD